MTTSSTRTKDAATDVVAAEPYESNEIRETEAEVEDTVEMQCIQLTHFDEEMGVDEVMGVADTWDDAILARDHANVAVAETIETSVRDVDVLGGFSTRKLDFSDRRAEFISVTFFKDHPNIPLGINFMRNEARVASLKENSLAADSPLRPNDKILSVNNKDCAELDSRVVADILQKSVGCVNIVVHNEGGAAEFVESMVMKSHPSEKVGISVKSVGNGSLVVGYIQPKSKFWHSLLNPGDYILSINGSPCSLFRATTAADLIKNSPKNVTILAKTLRDTGVVVAQISDRLLTQTSSNVPVLSANQGNQNNRPTVEPNGLTVSEQEKTFMIFCAILIVVGIAVGTAVGVTQSMEEENAYNSGVNNNDYYNYNNSYYNN
jgi:membrane-associated protease RseP (regulator of RpoE activity)